MRRIAFVETWTNPIYVQFANEFARQNKNWDVTFIADSDSTKSGAHFLDKRIHYVPLRNIKAVRRMVYLPFYIGSLLSKRLTARYDNGLYLTTYSGLAAALKRAQPDVIMANVLLMPYTMQAGRYARKHSIPFFLRTEERHPKSFVERVALMAAVRLNEASIRHAAAILPWTKQSHDYIHDKLPLAKGKTTTLPAGVNARMFRPKKDYRKKGTIQLLTVQRFVPYKDYGVLLRGLRAALDAEADVHLSILGSGPLEAEIKDTVHELGLAQHVTFLAPVPYERMPGLYRRHDVLVHTGRHEAIGMAVPEAMACGTPAIVCDTAGAVTYVDEKSGIVFRTGDAKHLARCIQSLSLSRIERQGKAARARIEKHFSVERVVKQFTQLLNRVVH